MRRRRSRARLHLPASERLSMSRFISRGAAAGPCNSLKMLARSLEHDATWKRPRQGAVIFVKYLTEKPKLTGCLPEQISNYASIARGAVSSASSKGLELLAGRLARLVG